MIMEYASGGELFEHILAHRYLKERDACRFFAQLVAGVSYLHGQNIVHRDLKLENLLLDGQRNVIITDFGFANRSSNDPDSLLLTSCGSPCYAAPELVISDGYVGEAADIWSCGVILYAMLCGYLPFDDDPNNPDGDNINLLYKYILETELEFPDYVGEAARDLLKRMLVPDPRFRANMREVMRHPWLEPFKYYFREEERRLYGEEEEPETPKVPVRTGTPLYETPPATPLQEMRVPGVPEEEEEEQEPVSNAAEELIVPNVDSAMDIDPAERQVAPVKSTSAMSLVENINQDVDQPVTPMDTATEAEAMSALAALDIMEQKDVQASQSDEAVVPIDGADMVPTDYTEVAVSKEMEVEVLDLPAVAEERDSTYGSQTEDAADGKGEAEELALPPTPPPETVEVFTAPTSVAEAAAAITAVAPVATEDTTPQRRSEVLERPDVRSVAFDGPPRPPIDDHPPKRVEYGRKSLDVRRAESAASRKSIFGWLKKSGYNHQHTVHGDKPFPMPPVPEPRPNTSTNARRPHSSVDGQQHSTHSTDSTPRTSVHAPSVISVASEWTVNTQAHNVPKVPQLRYHKGPIDQRALTGRPPGLVIRDVRSKLEAMGMRIYEASGEEGFRLKVIYRPPPMEVSSRNGQGPPVSFYGAAGWNPEQVISGLDEEVHEKRSKSRLASMLASFPVHLVKRIKYVARYGVGYNKGFGKHEAAAAAAAVSPPNNAPYLNPGFAASRESFMTSRSTRTTGTTFTTNTGSSTYGGSSSSSGEIRFVVEVQKIRNLPGLFVVEFKRMKGDVWGFKRLYQEVIGGLELGVA